MYNGVDATDIPTTQLSLYYPPAKIGGGNYVIAWGGAYDDGAGGNSNIGGSNYFAILVPQLTIGGARGPNAATGLTV